MVFDACDSFLFSGAVGATITQTTYSSPIDFKSGGTGLTTPTRVVVRYANAGNASGSHTVQFNVQTSTDGDNWFDRTTGAKEKLTLVSNNPKAGTVNLPLVTSDRFARLAVVVAGGGSTPTVTVLSADLNIAQL